MTLALPPCPHRHPREGGQPSTNVVRCRPGPAVTDSPALAGAGLRCDIALHRARNARVRVMSAATISTSTPSPTTSSSRRCTTTSMTASRPEIEEAVHILLEARLDALRRPDQGAGRGHAHRRHRFPRRHPVRAGGAARGQRHEGRHGDPAAAPRRDRRAQDRQDGDRHGQGRHPRHRQEPGLR